MNTKHTHQIRTATLATVVAFVACASTAAPAFAGRTPMATAREAPEPTASRRTPCRSRPSTA